MRVRSYLAALVVGTTISPGTPAAEFDEDYFRQVVDFGKTVHAQVTDSPWLAKFLNELDKKLDRQGALFSSMVDAKEIEAVVTETETLRKLSPPELQPMNNQPRIDKIAGVTDGSFEGGAAQLDRLQRAGNERRAAIDKLEDAKADAAQVAQSHAETVAIAEKVSKHVEKLVGDPVIEIIVLYKGDNFGLSWLDLETGLIPALRERAEAAKGVEKRLDDAIKLAKQDLEGYEMARQYAEKLWQSPESAAGDAVLQDIRQKMDANTRQAIAQANAWREEARRIDERNARIQKMRDLLNLMSSAASLGAAGTGGGNQEPGASTDTATPNNIILSTETQTYELKKTPERPAQAPVDKGDLP